ncbi:Os04g0540401, partial [Oryza sativa Japonica Group]
VGQQGVLIRRWHDALVAVEVHPPRERPSTGEGEVALVLLQYHLRLHITVLQHHLVVVLDPPEHPRVVCKIKQQLLC